MPRNKKTLTAGRKARCRVINTISSKSIRPVCIPLDMAIAEELFGWKWLAFTGIPTRGTPGYPANMKVRRFFPPEALTHDQWNEYFHEIGGYEPATGKEPLDYCYCSSSGPHAVPWFSGDLGEARNIEHEIEKRGLLDLYEGFLMAQVLGRGFDAVNEKIDSRRLRKATPEQICMAALSALGSKYVTQLDEEPTK